jgi:hypothetical protein
MPADMRLLKDVPILNFYGFFVCLIQVKRNVLGPVWEGIIGTWIMKQGLIN